MLNIIKILIIIFVLQDSRIRERNLDLTKEYLKKLSEDTNKNNLNIEDTFSKIWRSFFYCK